jgi:hypothetical protein
MLKPKVDDNTYLHQMGVGAATNTQPLESSACLLIILEHGPHKQAISGDEINAYVSPLTYGSAQVRVIKDGWGTPVVFNRWPTANPVVNPNGPQAGLGNDPADRQGALEAGLWNSAQFQTDFHPLPGASAAAVPTKSYNLNPLIVSAGPDLDHGLNLTPTGGLAVTNAATAGDDVYSSTLP